MTELVQAEEPLTEQQQAGIEKGLEDLRLQSRIGWLLGDGVLDWGWTPSLNGVNDGGLTIIKRFQSTLNARAEAQGLRSQTLDHSTLVTYATTAYYIKGDDRKNLTMYAGREITRRYRRGEIDNISEFIAAVRKAEGTVDTGTIEHFVSGRERKRLIGPEPDAMNFEEATQNLVRRALDQLEPEDQAQAITSALKQTETREAVKVNPQAAQEVRRISHEITKEEAEPYLDGLHRMETGVDWEGLFAKVSMDFGTWRSGIESILPFIPELTALPVAFRESTIRNLIRLRDVCNEMLTACDAPGERTASANPDDVQWPETSVIDVSDYHIVR